MFGYVIVNQPELKFKEYDIYRSYYCGLCRKLNEKYGLSGQLTLSYDMTFLILVLTGLYEPDSPLSSCRCVAHPLARHPLRDNEFTEYAADMNVILSYYSCLDDWSDERRISRLAMSKALSGKNKRACALREKKARAVRENLEKLRLYEKTGETDLDKAAGCFGELMAELFDCREDLWSPQLRRMGFFLGKFIYLMDAYDDVEEDQKKGNYNPLLPLWNKLSGEEFAAHCLQILTMMMAECCKAFETLPILENIAILRNILYSGVWSRYEAVTARRKNAQDQQGGKK